MDTPKEGNLEAPTRHPIDWKNPDFYNEDLLNQELERVVKAYIFAVEIIHFAHGGSQFGIFFRQAEA